MRNFDGGGVVHFERDSRAGGRESLGLTAARNLRPRTSVHGRDAESDTPHGNRMQYIGKKRKNSTRKCRISRLDPLTAGYALSLWIFASPVAIRKIAPKVNHVRLFPEFRVESRCASASSLCARGRSGPAAAPRPPPRTAVRVGAGVELYVKWSLAEVLNVPLGVKPILLGGHRTPPTYASDSRRTR
jgi:hypothetical protein